MVEEAGVAVVAQRGQPEEETGQLGRIRQFKLLKGPSIEHRWPEEEVVVEEEVMEDLLGFRPTFHRLI